MEPGSKTSVGHGMDYVNGHSGNGKDLLPQVLDSPSNGLVGWR